MERSAGLDAEWDRNRAEEEPEMWDLALLEKKIAAECEAQGVPMMPYPADFSDLAGHPRPGAGLGNEPAADVLDVIAQEILDIGRTHGWDAFGQAVERLKKEGL